MGNVNFDKLRKMIARCQWTFAKTMPFAPHEYIVRDKCPLTDEEFIYFVDIQRQYGVKERWGKYNNPYLYIDDYKYWTMEAPMEETKVMNRAKACVVEDAHKLYGGMKETEGNEYIDKYIHVKLGLKSGDKGYNINLISGRLDEIDACANHLRRIRNNYCSELINEWSKQLSKDFPNQKKCEFLDHADVMYTGVTMPYKDIPDAIAIRIQAVKGSLFYGFTYMPKIQEMRDELQESLSYVGLCNNLIKGKDWLYYKYVSYDKGYEKLKELIEGML
jgi:hypothetical protein